MEQTLTTDVVVVGSGAAGLSAALTAARAGRSVLVLERTEFLGGTTAMSGGLFYAPGNSLGRAAGFDATVEDGLTYLQAVARRPVDAFLARAFLENVADVVDGLVGAGVQVRLTGLADNYRDAPGWGEGRVLGTEPFDPTVLGGLAPAIRRSPYRDAETTPWTSGMSLTGTAQGVLLATGGFEFDSAQVEANIGAKLEGAWSCPGNQGDGLRLAVSAAAEITGLGEAQWYALLKLEDATLDEGAPLMFDASPARNLPGTVIVDSSGARFDDESRHFQEFGRSLAEAGHPAWLVFDQRFVDTYGKQAFGEHALAVPFVVSAPTVAGLATLVGVPAGTLTATLDAFSAAAAEGLDPVFHRGESAIDRNWGDTAREDGFSCLAPVDRPPFYATRVYAGCSGTTGGPRIDAGARVLGADGTPVPGLYAAGNVTADLFGGVAPASGSTLGPHLTFGHLAARTILAGL
jgi:3-oxosteroid 1-dehydrogenase